MTLLSIVQDACADIGWPQPNKVIGNSEALQFQRLLNREGKSLSRWQWEALVKEESITLVAADQDYALADGFRYLIPHTSWNRDDQRPIIWITSREWQFFKGWTTINGLNLRARVRNGQIEFEQTIASGDVGKIIAYEYVSSHWVEDANSAGKIQFSADDDVSVLDEELLTLGLIWRFKKAKGLHFETDLVDYQSQVKIAKAQDGAKRDLRLGRGPMQHLGVNTPEGSFPDS